tara:strand:- start:262 stop:666 length:405 start_codon:yes stop_codon:yes gene_type:complete
MAITQVKEGGLDITNAGSDGQFLKKAGTQFTWDTVDTSIADDSIAEVKLDISNAPSDGKFLQYKDSSDKLTWAAASSPEVYGFVKNGNNLNVITTNAGADNISGATYASFDEAFFAATGFSWSINASGNLIATI